MNNEFTRTAVWTVLSSAEVKDTQNRFRLPY